LPSEKPITPNAEVREFQSRLDGAWYGAAKLDPSELSPNDFQILKNMRYGDKHPEGVSGYTVLNDSAISTYTDLKQGLQLKTNRDDPSHVIVAGMNSGGTATQLYESTDAVPGSITFTSIKSGRSGGAAGSAFNDTTGNDPRMALIPQRQIAYSNEEASYIYGGTQRDCAGFWLCDDANLANPRDYWETVKNSLSSDTVVIDSASTPIFTVHSTRPLQGVWFTVSSANVTTSSLNCNVWTASGWTAVSNASDGTSSGGKALAQSGEYVFDSTDSTAVMRHFEQTFFYAYRFQLTAGSATITQVQVDAPIQEIVDVWDGVPRNAIFAGIRFSGDVEDFTAHVVETSTASVPIGLLLDGLTSSDRAYFFFEEQTAALQITMLSNLVNTETATLTVAYWDGDTWQTVSNLQDGTGAFNQSGLIYWTPPSDELPKSFGNITGYGYRITPSATLTGTHGDDTDSVVVDMVTGIPSQLSVGPYKFHSQYKGSHFGCGAVSDNEGYRIDYTAPYAPDVWNGLQSSNNKTQSIYLGSDENLTCGASLYNRYGSVDRLFEVWVGFSDSCTYQVKESSVDGEVYDYDTVSFNVGCPAPRTLTSANIGMETGIDGAKRNVLLWVDSSGPYSYDGSSLDPIRGIERYFDQNDDLHVGADISSAHGWFDPVYREWNLVLPGSVWVVYDLVRKKWYTKDPGDSYIPTCGFTVSDTNGSKYAYGGFESGEVARLEYGTTWDGEAIVQKIRTADIWPSGNIWDMTLIRRVKIFYIRIDEDHDVELIIASDSAAVGGAFEYYEDEYEYYEDEYEYSTGSSDTISISPDTNTGKRIDRRTFNKNILGWCHCLELTTSTTDTEKGFQPLGYGFEYRIKRKDY